MRQDDNGKSLRRARRQRRLQAHVRLQAAVAIAPTFGLGLNFYPCVVLRLRRRVPRAALLVEHLGLRQPRRRHQRRLPRQLRQRRPTASSTSTRMITRAPRGPVPHRHQAVDRSRRSRGGRSAPAASASFRAPFRVRGALTHLRALGEGARENEVHRGHFRFPQEQEQSSAGARRRAPIHRQEALRPRQGRRRQARADLRPHGGDPALADMKTPRRGRGAPHALHASPSILRSPTRKRRTSPSGHRRGRQGVGAGSRSSSASRPRPRMAAHLAAQGPPRGARRRRVRGRAHRAARSFDTEYARNVEPKLQVILALEEWCTRTCAKRSSRSSRT